MTDELVVYTCKICSTCNTCSEWSPEIEIASAFASQVFALRRDILEEKKEETKKERKEKRRKQTEKAFLLRLAPDSPQEKFAAILNPQNRPTE